MSQRNNVIDVPTRGDPAVKEKPKTKKPSMYNVLMLNDDFTPMEFVVRLLQDVFHFDLTRATALMYEIHRKGVGLCGTYTLEVAETKVNLCLDRARKEQHPLQTTLEKA